MQPHGNNWLTVLNVALVLVCISGKEALAQETLAESEHGVEQTLSAQTAKQKSLDATRETRSADHELSALLKQLEDSTDDLGRDASGNVLSVALRSTNANNQALFLVSTLGSLQELTIQGRGLPGTDEWTREGISCLRKLTNLVTLRVACIALKPALTEKASEAIRGLGDSS